MAQNGPLPIEQLRALPGQLANYFSFEELRELAFELRLDHENIPGNTKEAFARELVLALNRELRLPRLLDRLKAKRQGVEWALEDLDRPAEPPYRGLDFYREEDAELFFGRDRLVAELIGRLRTHPFLAVIGASGSGKSSLVRAGVLPVLKYRQKLVDSLAQPVGSADWAYLTLTPTERPLERLAVALTSDRPGAADAAILADDLRVAPDHLRPAAGKYLERLGAPRLFLLIDQFEEVFTLCKDVVERRAFINGLIAATGGQVTAVLTLRADFYHHCDPYPALRAALEQHQTYIGAPDRDELRAAIVEPALRRGYTLEEGLAEVMLRDAGDEPGALPLLSHALLETWHRRDGRTLTLDGYNRAGGVQGAIAHTADSTFYGMSPDCQAIARDIFLALTEVGESGPDTRRVAQRPELDILGDPAAVSETLNALATARLVTIGETIQVAHEALIRSWATLQGWLNESRAQLIFRRQLRQAAALWKSEQLDGYLYRDEVLAQAEARLRDDKVPLTEDVALFLAASRQAEAAAHAAEEREREQARQDVRRDIPFVMIGGAIGLGISGYLMLAFWLGATNGFLSTMTLAFIVLGAIVGLFYAPVFDWVIARAGSRKSRRRLLAALVGFIVFGLALCLLNIGSREVNFLLLFALGGVWGVAAGLGRIWPPFRLPRLLAVALVCGGILGLTHLIVQLLGKGSLLGISPNKEPLPVFITFAAGVLLPLSVLLAEWISNNLSQRSLR